MAWSTSQRQRHWKSFSDLVTQLTIPDKLRIGDWQSESYLDHCSIQELLHLCGRSPAVPKVWFSPSPTFRDSLSEWPGKYSQVFVSSALRHLHKREKLKNKHTLSIQARPQKWRSFFSFLVVFCSVIKNSDRYLSCQRPHTAAANLNGQDANDFVKKYHQRWK